MFRVVFLNRLTQEESRDAILKPIDNANCPVRFSDKSVNTVIETSGGYPYFIQFMCREIYDVWIQRMQEGKEATVPIEEILRKLDTDFFAGRWARATDRQHELLRVIAYLPNCEEKFTVQEIVERSRDMNIKTFGSSHVNQMLGSLSNAGLIYKNRHGRYSFAVPLLGEFIKRQHGDDQPQLF